MSVHLPEAEATVDQLIAEGRPNDALANIYAQVYHTHQAPEWKSHHLYYPGFDRQMQQLAGGLELELEPGLQPDPPARHGTLVIASEMYPTGGHSRVIEDIVREAPTPTIVLTDLWWRYRKQPDHLNAILDANPNASVLFLLQRTLWDKCRELRKLTQRLAPASILYLQHHYDPIAFVGTLGHRGSRKTLVHHCDHNPSLGNSVDGIGHADFSEEMAAQCSAALARPATVLPLYVRDTGAKRFEAAAERGFSVVTSGTANKFARSGPLALQAIVAAALGVLSARFYHIGPMEAEWLAEIRTHLAQQGIAPERFVPLGPVSSLWDTLAGLDAHLYIGSAPVGGGRAAIEAQGCGYPVAYFRVKDQGTAIGTESVYANPAIGWSSVEQLTALLRDVAPHLAGLSQQARALYEARFSREQFVRVLGELTALP
jgi:hypothetical protein